MNWGKPCLCYSFFFSSNWDDTVCVLSRFVVRFTYSWLDFLVIRSSGDEALEEQFNRFAKGTFSEDDEADEQEIG